ncbi:MAG: DUF4062 domain-containing protein [Oceanospirillaceae bacterium]|nr:DUF4062 domain-containing protein [Oceanospirillaceae bacterium]
MASPRVFISSTCYDLKHIRESIKYFVKNLGYEPVLSDDGDVFYNPIKHTHDSCIDEVSTCQLFVLIIGGRYGGAFKETESSITNEEYKIAISNNIPVFTFVEAAALADHHLYQSNINNQSIDENSINYPAADNIKIFKFINEVRLHSKNNAISPFNNYLDIETYLKKQWAGMLYDFLNKSRNEQQSKLTNSLLSDLSLVSKKTEELLKTVYGKLDEANASEVINNISDTINAEVFIERMMDITEYKLSNYTTLDKLLNTSTDNGMAYYLIHALDLIASKGYASDDQELKFLVNTKSTVQPLVYMEKINGKWVDALSDSDVQSFRSFSALSSDSKKELLFESLQF